MLSTQDKTRIKDAVAQAESGTAGELVVVAARRSSDYAFLRSVGALGVSVVVTWELLLATPLQHHFLVLMAQVPLFFALFGLLGLGPLLRTIVRRPVRQEKVMARALRAFIEEGVTETRDRSGVLIFLSQAERQVVILADKGINDRVEPREWETDVGTITSAIKQGRAGDGVVLAVERIGALLAEAFPPRPDDTNELSDTVREVD